MAPLCRPGWRDGGSVQLPIFYLGLTVRDLAAAADVSHDTIIQFEAGETHRGGDQDGAGSRWRRIHP
ncbi:MAG TPA: hypothetical protein VFL96_12270 [Acidobacteriaceae bacterium]|nr:hypothetical protein [Acidobacteriaceae bacterium]